MANEIYFRKRLSVITIILIYCLTNALCELQCNDDGDANCVDRDNDSRRVLSRKRRALTFPEGSSLQLGELQHLQEFSLSGEKFLHENFKIDEWVSKKKMSMKFPLNKLLIELLNSGGDEKISYFRVRASELWWNWTERWNGNRKGKFQISSFCVIWYRHSLVDWNVAEF